jgi:DNA polymerase-3 subunit gamma/tau
MAKKKTPAGTEVSPQVEAPASPAEAAPRSYTVVARRYRPQQFADLIGQEHVAKALVNALQTGRVAHAYLFTGARGVGKTSAARILAKALNCVDGPTATPCDKCDSCKAVATGEDVDVLEIDGASNNRVEEARELRQNVGFRPSRSRFKIYIIDEVHMLSTSAFNALLKTLEEPPPHVKFIFATTEVQKIPITILSRCQRFDFANVGPGKIFEMLKRIVTLEGLEADEEALRLIARRAAGSMRDSHSLLDQLLASAQGKLSVETVHAVLGTAGEEQVNALAVAILNHDAKLALDLVAAWYERGLQAAELVEQMISYWRSLMLVHCGGPEVRELPLSPSQKQTIAGQARELSLDTILAGLEVWTTARSRLRDSFLAPIQVEMSVVRLAQMNDLVPIGQLVNAVTQGGLAAVPVTRPAGPIVPAAGEKKNDSSPREGCLNGQNIAREQSILKFDENNIPEIWQRLLQYLREKSPILANHLKTANLPAIFGPNSLAIRFAAGYNLAYEACATESNTARVQEGFKELTGQSIAVRFEQSLLPPSTPVGVTSSSPPANPATERRKTIMNLPMFQKVQEVLGAQIWHLDEDFDPNAAPKVNTATPDDADEV